MPPTSGSPFAITYLMVRSAVAFTLSFVLLGTASVAAQPGKFAPERQPPTTSQELVSTVTTETKYGYQILLADLAMVGVAAGTESGAAALMYFFGSPTIHVLNGNNAGAGLSLLARVTLPAAGAAVGLAVAQCDSSGDEFLCGFGEVFVGASIGLAGALAIDYFVLAKKKETRRVRRTFRPAASVSREGDLRLGIAGRF